MICSRFLIRNKAARRAERGPSPGNRASNAIRRSISGPATAVAMNYCNPGGDGARNALMS